MHAVKFYFSIIFTCLFLTANGQDLSLTLDGTWNFKIDPNNVGETQNWAEGRQSKNGWDSIAVPGNWDIKNEYSHYVGKAWYQKNVLIPKTWTREKVYLNFEGVYFTSRVWLNGKLLGSNDHGFLPFQFNVSDLINRKGNNVIVVCADNTFRLGATWNWGGIRRSVRLLAYDDVRITSQRITPTVNVDRGTASLNVQVFLTNEGPESKQINGIVEINSLNLEKKNIPFKAVVAPHENKSVTVNIELDKKSVHLWHFDDPFLYTCDTRIIENGKTINHLQDKFGLRKIEVDNKNYSFKINGESVRLMGFNLIPDDRTTGNTLPLWRIKADIDDMKALGCNMARLSHFPLPKEMYDYLDERGILVFPEVSLWGAEQKVDPDNQVPKEWLKRMINNNYNHPCIIGWSVGNEIGQNSLALAYVKEATAMARSLDPTRLAVVVSHTADKQIDIINDSDIGLVNKYSANLGPITKKMHSLHPDKLLFYSEYGISQTSEDLDGDINAKSLLDSIRYKPYVMGASLWTYNDYRSNFLGTKGFSESRPWGIVNDFRQRKKSWYSFQKEYCPLKNLQIESIKTDSSKSTAELLLVPREKLDLPSYAIKNYRLTCKVSDNKGNLLTADFIDLPLIEPGTGVLKRLISWNQPANAAEVQIELVSPLNYALSDTTIYFSKPNSPNIIYSTGESTLLNDYREKTGGFRIVFQKSFLAQGYKVKYGKDQLISETPITVNNFIDVNGLDFNESYNLSLIAVNAKGESEGSVIRHIATSYFHAPPVVKYTEPADKGVFIGYETTENDYLFNVRYSTVSGDYKNAITIQSTNKGVLFIPNLINGETYFFQIQRMKQNSNLSSWSAEFNAKPDGGMMAETPVINGIVQKGMQALVLFTPVEKSIGYILKFHVIGDKDWKSITITAAQINQYMVTGLNAVQKYEFKLATLNSIGISAFSTIKSSF
jgi:beta-galactosidase